MNRTDRPYGRRADDAQKDESASSFGASDVGSCDAVLVALSQARDSGVPVTIWDLPKLTALPLQEAFAAVRALEHGRLINVADNLSDPFGALLELRDDGMTRLRELKFA